MGMLTELRAVDPFAGEQQWLINKVLISGLGIGFLHN